MSAMNQAADTADFDPPPESSLFTDVPWALGAHLAVLVALVLLGMTWQRREIQSEAIEAEIWAATVQQAAPAAPPEPPPLPTPSPTPQPKPTPLPPPPQPTPTPQPDTREADIAREQREKERQRLEKERHEKERLEKELLEKERQEKQRAEQEKRERERAEKERLEKQLRQEKERLDRERRADERRQAEAERKAETARRAEALRRMNALAGSSSGSGGSSGQADRDAGPSGSFAARVKARVKPNIVFTDDINGNPVADVQVQTTPDGQLISARLVKSSGNPAWDQAVVRAVEKTGSMPRDVDGRVHTQFIIGFRPKD